MVTSSIRNRIESAQPSFSALSSHYASTHWTAIETSLILADLECTKRLKRPKDREWVGKVVRLLRGVVEVTSEDPDEAMGMRIVVKELSEAVKGLDKG